MSYKPVACSFYDQLELYGLQGKKITIEYSDVNGFAQVIETEIKTLKIEKSVEYLITKEGLEIRLDLIKNVKPKS